MVGNILLSMIQQCHSEGHTTTLTATSINGGSNWYFCLPGLDNSKAYNYFIIPGRKLRWVSHLAVAQTIL